MDTRSLAARLPQVVNGLIVALLALMLLAAGSASAETVPLPRDAATGTGAAVELEATSCPITGGCVAVGLYENQSAALAPLIETETRGAWAVTDAPLTGLGTVQQAGLQEISCPSAGNCVAVGWYVDGSGGTQGLIENESNGSWSAGKLPLTGLTTAADPNVAFTGLSCGAAGSCTAVGYYADAGHHEEGLIATDSGGTWAAVEANVSAIGGNSATPAVQLNSISCAAAGSCAAVGYYVDSSSHEQGLLETESGGTWTASRANLASLPSVAANPNVQLNSVSCPAVGDCTAVGRYVDASSVDGSYQPMVLSLSSSGWSAAAKATLPADANFTAATVAQQNLVLDSVSCWSSGNCLAVGSYDATAANYERAVELSETNGSWSAGVEASTPTTGAANPYAQLNSVACTELRCTAVGIYLDSASNTDVWVTGATHGSATSSTEVGLLSQPEAEGTATIACSASDYCNAGGFGYAAGITSPFLLDPPAAATVTSATAAGTSAQVSWSAPANTGGLPVTGYTITASDQTASSRGGQSVTVGAVGSATVPGLTPGDTYTFTITPTSVLGNGLQVSTAGVLVPLPPVPPPTVVSFSATQLTASLAGLLVPHGPGSRLSKLARTHGYTFKWTPLEAGTATVRWYAKTGKGKHRRRHLIGSGTTTASAATAIAVHVRLNRTGRRLVKSDRRLHRRLHVTATVKFTAGTTTVTATHTFTLH